MKMRQLLIGASVALAAVAVLGAVKFFQIRAAIQQNAGFRPPPTAVTSLVVEEDSWPVTFKAVGSLAPSQGVVLGTEESGTVAKINFESGQEVQTGDLLVELDTSVEEARLRGAEAVEEQARLSLVRVESLRANNAVSQADLENARAKHREAKASSETVRETIGRKKIRAPFSGRTGIRQVNVGQYLAPGTGVVPLYRLDPLYVNFSIPQSAVANVETGQKVTISVDAFPVEEFSGTLTAVNPQIDSVTRNLDLQGTIANPGGKLRPGMFARVILTLPESVSFISIPESGIEYAPYGDSVYVIEGMKGSDGAEYSGVRKQIVKVGARKGDRISILDGLKPGQKVVTSGTFRLHPGAEVIESGSITPGNELNPKPEDT